MHNVNTLFAEFRGWVKGDLEFDALHPDVQKAIDELIDEEENLTKGQPTVSQVSQGGSPPKKKKKRYGMAMSAVGEELIQKADDEQMFTLGPWYIPNKQDAHAEWTDADELQKALWEYVRTGDRDIRLQHNKDIVAGEWVEAMSFPVPITLNMTKASGEAKEVTYPKGTVFLGVKWNPWAWELVKQNKITGFSIGGSAARIEMGVPTDESVVGKSAELKDLMRAYIGDAMHHPADKTAEPAADDFRVKINGVGYTATPLNKSHANGVTSLLNLRGDDGSVVVIRHDGRNYWASGSGALPKMQFDKAQLIFGDIAKAKSFQGNRSAAGAYAANIRWSKRAQSAEMDSAMKGVDAAGRGPIGLPTTPEGKRLHRLIPSLGTHCDFDGLAADMKAAGIDPIENDPKYDMVRNHLSPQRRELHDKIIDGHFVNEDGSKKTQPSGQPEYVFMGGGPAAGKSTMLNAGHGPEWAGNGTNKTDSKGKAGTDKHSVAVNADEIKGELPPYPQLLGSDGGKGGVGVAGRLGQMGAASVVHEESSMLSKEVNSRAIQGGFNVVMDGTGDNSPKSMRKKMAEVREAKGPDGKPRNYKMTAIYATVPTEVAVQRAIDRGRPIGQRYTTPDGRQSAGQGRYVPATIVAGTHRSVSRVLPEISAEFDEVKLFNTMGKTPKLLASGRRGKKMTVADKAGYAEFLGKGEED